MKDRKKELVEVESIFEPANDRSSFTLTLVFPYPVDDEDYLDCLSTFVEEAKKDPTYLISMEDVEESDIH